MILVFLGLLAAASAGSSTDNKDSYKNQLHGQNHTGKRKGQHETFTSEYCTDPRTMKKHPAYTEWADAYSCTRHRCQPGGRNLAIYTVGCKRVEAPESAIECEEVVEDTNMQFPFCCTRLRCLVVVRGEVWTRVLGQPWEVLPAAPWSHMYKMKKPPPADSTFLPKTADQGPVYELSESDSEQGHEKVLRSAKKANSNQDYSDPGQQPVVRAALPGPDIVIALSTNEGKEEPPRKSARRAKHRNANTQPAESNYFEEETEKEKHTEPKNQEVEEQPAYTEKPQEATEEENPNYNYYAVTEKTSHNSYNTHNPVSWTEIPQNEWSEPKEGTDMENRINDLNNNYRAQEPQREEPQTLVMAEPKPALHIPLRKEGDKPSNLQALVDAIGSRMRDIESVVQKMSDKVHQVKNPAEGSGEKRISAEREVSHKHHKEIKRPSGEDENYKRFTAHNERGSKYLHSSADSTTENPLFIEDTNLTGYFSDASNSVLRRNNPPKEPPPTYMAPVETRRKNPQVHIAVPNTGEDDKKRKKHAHKKRKGKGSRSHRKHSHSKDEKRKHFNRLSSGEAEKNAVSLEDSSEAVQ
ncbi:hypothetical protein PYW07_011898 [Mythimna separata]|uniref:Uncharacterized protein n=1 Tax=Mythimna separata TaxID=271217 RepID=A0AAD8DKT0_MYTSE|nr:hypothetical protein PYW07_011898 [Mythimna separata]